MDFSFTTIYTYYLTAFTWCFALFPISMCLDWKKRGTSDGFSGVNFAIPIVVMGCWIKYYVLLADGLQVALNVAMVAMMMCYLLVFYFYQPNKTTVRCQVATACVVLAALVYYADGRPTDAERIDTMGSIAASAQTASMAGQIYEIYRVVFLLHTTEYLPAFMTFGGALMVAQWMAFGLLTGDIYMVYANISGVVLSAAMLLLYVLYPPLTWRVPVFGTGPTGELSEKREKAN